jgi:hypothetical protein
MLASTAVALQMAAAGPSARQATSAVHVDHAGSATASGSVATPPGLRPAGPGSPCAAAGFELRYRGTFLGCTHGSDPAPPGAGPRSVADLKEQAAAATAAAGGGIRCSGDGTSGKRVQAIYAFISGRTDHSATVVPLIRTWAAYMNAIYNASAAETNGSRQIRWVHSNSSKCQLTVSKVTLPSTTVNNFSATINALRNKGFNKSNRKYAVWMDVPQSQSGICGIGQIIVDESPGSTNKNNGVSSVPGMVERTDVDCWGLLDQHSTGGFFAVPPQMVEAHEIGHTLGAVQSGAPHHTALHHCTDEWDLMCYDDDFNSGTFPLTFSSSCPVTQNVILDCRHNDYFHTHPTSGYLKTHWNAAKNAFLMPNVTPGNDKFTGAMPLAGGPGTYVASNRLATPESGEPSTAGQAASRSIWFTVKPTSNGTLTVDTDRSKIDTVLGVYTGASVGALSLVGQNDNVGAKTFSRVSVPVSSGTTYRIKVDGKGGAQGLVMLFVGLGNTTPVITGFTPTSGPPGTVVTLTGQNIIVCGATTCDGFVATFNGKGSASCPSCSTDGSTTLQVKVPSGASDGPITLNDDRGATISAANFNVA